MMKTKFLTGAVWAAAAVAVSGCSTIMHGTHEKVEIVSTPAKAHCSIYRESEGYLKSVVTPGAVYVPRAAEPIRVICKKDGYKNASVVASPAKNSDIVGNVAGVGGAVGGVAAPAFIGGAFVDTATGATQDLPDIISVRLQKQDG